MTDYTKRPRFADIEITCNDGEVLYFHRLLLCRSPVFDSALTDSDREIKIDADTRAVGAFLNLLAGTNVSRKEIEVALDLMHKYDYGMEHIADIPLGDISSAMRAKLLQQKYDFRKLVSRWLFNGRPISDLQPEILQVALSAELDENTTDTSIRCVAPYTSDAEYHGRLIDALGGRRFLLGRSRGVVDRLLKAEYTDNFHQFLMRYASRLFGVEEKKEYTRRAGEQKTADRGNLVEIAARIDDAVADGKTPTDDVIQEYITAYLGCDHETRQQMYNRLGVDFVPQIERLLIIRDWIHDDQYRVYLVSRMVPRIYGVIGLGSWRFPPV